MSPEAILAIVGAAIIALTLSAALYKRAPKRLKRSKYTRKWRDIQRLCADSSNWPQAIMLADQLLDSVLRKRNKPGKTMGERMVSSQKTFSNNDAIWQAHKFANHIRAHESQEQLSETRVKESLIAFRQALRDLGVL